MHSSICTSSLRKYTMTRLFAFDGTWSGVNMTLVEKRANPSRSQIPTRKKSCGNLVMPGPGDMY
ncbi:hypothetical protein WAI453_013188 [Rhynchosporium graminicola]